MKEPIAEAGDGESTLASRESSIENRVSAGWGKGPDATQNPQRTTLLNVHRCVRVTGPGDVEGRAPSPRDGQLSG